MTDLDMAKMYVNKYRNAESRGIYIDLSFSEFKRLVSRKTCHYCGDKFDDTHVATKRSIERVDSAKGYTLSNCVVVMGKMNSIKNILLEQTDSKYNVTIKQLKHMAGKL